MRQAWSRGILRQARTVLGHEPAHAHAPRLSSVSSDHSASCRPCTDPEFFPLAQPVQSALNEQIGAELGASFQYLAMVWAREFRRERNRTNVALHLSRVSLSLRGAAAMLHANAEEEREHAELVMAWLVSRGGLFVPPDIPAPSPSPSLVPGPGRTDTSAWEELSAAILAAIAMERQVTQSLLHVQRVARGCRDIATADFFSRTMLREQVRALNFLGQLHTRIIKARGSSTGLHQVDDMLYQKYKHS